MKKIIKNFLINLSYTLILFFGLSSLPYNTLFAEQANSETSSVYIEKNVAVPMRDGIILRADVRRPAKDGKYPVLIFRTPYGKNEGDPHNERTFEKAVARGYAVVIQDVRGRYESQGEYTPYINEGKDGYDTIEWAAAQPWSDSRVGTFGLSYPGAVQWLAAIENPPHLKAMVPAMCFYAMNQFIYYGGVFETDWTSWVYRYMSPYVRTQKGIPGPQTDAEAEIEYDKIGADTIQGYLPLLDMPYLKDTAPYYYDWIKHKPYDPYWNFGDLRDKYSKVNVAVLNLSGWYDEAYGPEGAITNYNGLVNSRAGWSDTKTKLIIGPWTHGVRSTTKNTAGDRKFADNAKIDYDKIILDWLDYHVRGINNDVPIMSDVVLYMMGDNVWITDKNWPVQNAVYKSFYLDGIGSSNNIGTVTPSKPDSLIGSSSFFADPLNPVRDIGGTNFGAYDLKSLSNRSDVLTFESPILTEDIAVAGNIKAEIYMSSDAPDNDLLVKVLDVFPDGTAYNLMSPGAEIQRVSYRDKTPERHLLNNGEIIKLSLDHMFTGNTFKKGHRIRVCIMASYFPIYARNLQTGKLEDESSETAIAKITIYHNNQNSSRILLPVVEHLENSAPFCSWPIVK